MLEFLILALLSQQTQNFFADPNFDLTPRGIEILSPAKVPILQAEKIAPQLLEDKRTAILALDLGSGKTLLSRRADRAQPIASLTKILTALIILENHNLDEIVSVSLEATQVKGAQVGLYEYEKLTVQTLLEATLIPSANDAALALAIFHAGSEAEFVRRMNRRAKELGLDSAEFFNVTGLDIKEERRKKKEERKDGEMEKIYGNQMSARDILKLARIALENKFFRETVSQRHFYGTSVDEKFFHEKASTNQLFDTFVNVKGVKTGFTRLAGENFVALGETSDGYEVITVILGSPDRFGETKKFLSWIYDSFEWR